MKKSNDEQKLAVEPVGKLLFSLAVPAVLSQVVNALYNIIDRVFIGHIPGTGAEALTGVGVSFPIIIIVASFANLIGMGSAPRAGIFLGRKEKDVSEKILGNAVSSLVIAGVVIPALIFVLREPLLYLFGASENTIEFAKSYISIYLSGSIFALLALGLNLFISAEGFTKKSMQITMTGAFLNIALDPVFIYLLKFGVRGAAIATIISQFVSAMMALKFLSGDKTLIKIRKENLKIDMKILVPCLALGTAPFIMMFTESVLLLCFNKSLLRYGGDIAVGAMTICSSIVQCGILPLNGITQGGQAIMSYNFGAERIDRVSETFKRQTAACFTYAGIIWFIAMFLPQVPIRLFTSDAELVNYTVKAIRVYSAGMIFMGLQTSCQQSFVALGNAKVSAFLALFRKIIVLIPLMYILPHFMENKVFGVLVAEPVADIMAASLTCIMFYFEFKKVKEKYQNV